MTNLEPIRPLKTRERLRRYFKNKTKRGLCRRCPKRLDKYKYLCDECQLKQYEYNNKRRRKLKQTAVV
jgi:hypothetical protein